MSTAADMLRRHLLPALFARPEVTPFTVAPALASFKGHRMAKSAVEMAVLDAWPRARSLSFKTTRRTAAASASRSPTG
ncbi:hypothetical protein ACFZCG_38550 [Streptomyces tanashiensis]|uniref:hypothetical protein n=1 Tax=Streptomyces tanashiensis TaxID=67367 RepID=UPI0036EFD661